MLTHPLAGYSGRTLIIQYYYVCVSCIGIVVTTKDDPASCPFPFPSPSRCK